MKTIEKVIFTGASDAQVNWGSNDDPRKVLKEGQQYEVEYEDVHTWHTKIKLIGIDGVFNNSSFETQR